MPGHCLYSYIGHYTALTALSYIPYTAIPNAPSVIKMRSSPRYFFVSSASKKVASELKVKETRFCCLYCFGSAMSLVLFQLQYYVDYDTIYSLPAFSLLCHKMFTQRTLLMIYRQFTSRFQHTQFSLFHGINGLLTQRNFLG